VQIRWLLTCVVLVGCGAQNRSGAESTDGQGALNAARASAASQRSGAGFAVTVSQAEMERYFPLSRYGHFPVEARRLLQKADFEQDECRGTFRGPATYRACNRSWEASVALERVGWCWGNETAGPSADDHWLRCSRIRGYHAGWAGAQPPFSEQEIREAADEAAHQVNK
jgi:hypothetical protein